MERHQGSWKVEGEEEYNIGELVIDNDYIEFFVRGKSIPWACTFIGSNGEHPIKVYAKGPGETKHRSLNMSIGYRVVKVAMTNAGFQEGFEINNISAFSFEIPELVDWLKINSVSIGFTEANELFAIEEKIEPIIIKNENPHIEISFGPASPFMPPEINDRVEYVVKNYPRVHVSYEEMVTDERVYADIQILMRFFGMLIGYVSYAKDIRLNIEGKDLKTWIWFNEDFSHNLRHLNGIDRFRTEYSQVKDELANYLMGYGFSVVHDKTYHDYPAYTGSYTRSKKTVEGILQSNPTDIIIDLHRDAIGSKSNYDPSVKIGDDVAAQLMFVIGTNGGGLYHPNWGSNLKFAIEFQAKANEMYPGLFKTMIVRNSRYNQNLGKAACIIEVGSTGNTLEQCINSMKYLSKVFEEYREQKRILITLTPIRTF